MALIVETGAIIANANSYNTIVEADAYFALRNNTTWDNLDETDAKAPYLIKAVDYMQQAFRARWQGYRSSDTQVLDWPRYYVRKPDSFNLNNPFIDYSPSVFNYNYYDHTLVPQEIKTAQLELALRITNGELAPDLDRVEKIVKVGSIQVEYDLYSVPGVVFAAVEMLLSPFFKSYSSGGARIGRS